MLDERLSFARPCMLVGVLSYTCFVGLFPIAVVPALSGASVASSSEVGQVETFIFSCVFLDMRPVAVVPALVLVRLLPQAWACVKMKHFCLQNEMSETGLCGKKLELKNSTFTHDFIMDVCFWNLILCSIIFCCRNVFPVAVVPVPVFLVCLLPQAWICVETVRCFCSWMS